MAKVDILGRGEQPLSGFAELSNSSTQDMLRQELDDFFRNAASRRMPQVRERLHKHTLLTKHVSR